MDELRLIVHPLIAGEGPPLLTAMPRRSCLDLRRAEPLPGGRLSLVYGVA